MEQFEYVVEVKPDPEGFLRYTIVEEDVNVLYVKPVDTVNHFEDARLHGRV